MKRLFAATAAMLVVSSSLIPEAVAGNDTGAYEVIANAFGFSAEIPGCPDASKNIREIAIDDLKIDVLEVGTTPEGGRLYGPGAAHWGNARFTSACTLGGSKELKAWFDECAKGKNIRKNITVTLFKSDKTPGRSYLLFDCFPTQWSVVMDEENSEALETVTVAPTRIEFISSSETSPPEPGTRAEATSSDKFAQVRGFQVEISGATGKEVDTAWESISGGLEVIELTETTIGSDKFQTSSPGHKSVGEITLRGAMTDKRAALCTWINETVTGKPWKRDLSSTELLAAGAGISPEMGARFSYHDCFPVGYVFPQMSVTNTTGNMIESMAVRAVREDELPEGVTAVLEIEGCPESSKAALALAIDPRALDLALIGGTTDARDAFATVLLPEGAGGELLDWYHEFAAAKAAKKAAKKKKMSARIYVGGRPTGRTVTLYDCFPTQFSALSPASSSNTASSDVQTETLTVKVGRIEFK